MWSCWFAVINFCNDIVLVGSNQIQVLQNDPATKQKPIVHVAKRKTRRSRSAVVLLGTGLTLSQKVGASAEQTNPKDRSGKT